MSDLVAFLNARLDEDEAAARAASGGTVVGERGNWSPAPGGDEWEVHLGGGSDAVEVLVALRPCLPRPPAVMSGLWGQVACWVDEGHPDWRSDDYLPNARHIARHDPARVLADCAAKRAVIALHTEASISTGHCGECMGELPCPTVRLFAQPYSGHPHFHPSWAAD